MTEKNPLLVELDKVQYDLTALKVRVSEIQRQIAELPLPVPSAIVCDDCSLQFRGTLSYAEHRYYAHQGPVPPQWEEAEALAAVDTDDAA